MMIRTDKMLFVTDPECSDEYIEILRTEYNTNRYRLDINKTLHPPFYQLFLEFKEGKREFRIELYCSSHLDKILKLINDNI